MSILGVANRFFSILDFSYLNLGIRDFKAKSGRDLGLKVSREVGYQKRKSSGLRDCTKFGLGNTGMKNPIEDPQYILCAN